MAVKGSPPREKGLIGKASIMNFIKRLYYDN